ncbi:MAG: alpha/beta fold hydrolase [Microbacteriaceae bacterium]
MKALLLHGLSSSPDGWWRVRGWLEDSGWQTETLALLGHGGRPPAPSYALGAYVDDIRAAGGRYDLVIGHSLGACVATVIASEDPGWTTRLVLLDPVWYIPSGDLPAIAADQAAELRLTEQTLRAQKPHWDDRDVAGKLSAIAAVDPAAVTRTFAEVDRWDLRDAARRILTRTLVLGGDPAVYTMLEPADGYEVAEDAADMRYIVVPGAGHSPHRDAPAATRAALEEWLEEPWNAG